MVREKDNRALEEASQALQEAIFSSDSDVGAVQSALARGANPSHVSPDGPEDTRIRNASMLMHAVRSLEVSASNLDKVRALLDAGADVHYDDGVNHAHTNAIGCAIFCELDDDLLRRECVGLLLSAGVRASTVSEAVIDRWGHNVLDFRQPICRVDLTIFDGHPECIEKLRDFVLAQAVFVVPEGLAGILLGFLGKEPLFKDFFDEPWWRQFNTLIARKDAVAAEPSEADLQRKLFELMLWLQVPCKINRRGLLVAMLGPAFSPPVGVYGALKVWLQMSRSNRKFDQCVEARDSRQDARQLWGSYAKYFSQPWVTHTIEKLTGDSSDIKLPLGVLRPAKGSCILDFDADATPALLRNYLQAQLNHAGEVESSEGCFLVPCANPRHIALMLGQDPKNEGVSAQVVESSPVVSEGASQAEPGQQGGGKANPGSVGSGGSAQVESEQRGGGKSCGSRRC